MGGNNVALTEGLMVGDCFVSLCSHCLTRSPHFALAFIAFMAFALLPPFFFGAAAASAAFFARFMPFAMLILQTLTGVQEDRRQRNAGFWRLLEPKQRITESQCLRSLLYRGIKTAKHST